jgi:hypothetical protein
MAKAKKPRNRKMWYADKRLGTCYEVKATGILSPKPFETWFSVVPHNQTEPENVQVGRGIAESRDSAYSWLINSLNDDMEKLVWKIRRAASEIA